MSCKAIYKNLISFPFRVVATSTRRGLGEEYADNNNEAITTTAAAGPRPGVVVLDG